MKDNYPVQKFDSSNWDYAYFAGLIDSDGTITLDDCGGNKPLLRVAFSQKSQHMCQSIAKRFGGSVTPKIIDTL